MRALLLIAALTATALVTFTLPAQAQWTLQQSPTTADLRGIDNAGRGIAWASGTNGTVLRTEDAGYLWQVCTIPPGAEHLDFRGIQAFDANTAIVMSSGPGDQSRLYKTTDGCQTWKLVFTNPDKTGFWDSLRFESANPHLTHHIRRGVIVGDPVDGRFALFSSSDLGETWVSLGGPPLYIKRQKAQSGETLFAASDTAADAVGDANNLAFVTGGKGGSRLYHLTGGGLVLDAWWSSPSFEKTELNLPHSSNSEGAFSLAHREVDAVTFDFMAVGGDYSQPDMPGFSEYIPAARYNWFGRHQQAQAATTPPHGYRSAVAYDPTTKTWITVGPNGTDISTDDGRNWRPLHPTANEAPDAAQHWNALSLPYAVGPHGRIGYLNPSALQPLP
jgi:photosystem II stability/assembly factor-like uncharacterized protein